MSDLATKTRAAPTLLGDSFQGCLYSVYLKTSLIYGISTARILRYFASVGIVKETGKDTFTYNNITEALTLPGVVGGIYH